MQPGRSLKIVLRVLSGSQVVLAGQKLTLLWPPGWSDPFLVAYEEGLQVALSEPEVARRLTPLLRSLPIPLGKKRKKKKRIFCMRSPRSQSTSHTLAPLSYPAESRSRELPFKEAYPHSVTSASQGWGRPPRLRNQGSHRDERELTPAKRSKEGSDFPGLPLLQHPSRSP